MSDKLKFGLVIVAYVAAGVVTGATFGKAMYHKGKAEAYEEITKDLENLANKTKEAIAKKEAEEAK